MIRQSLPSGLMRIFMAVFASILCSVIGASCVSENQEEPAVMGDLLTVGQPLPDFDIFMADGSRLSNASLLGKPSVIVFFNTSCSDCRRELPNVQKVFDEYSDNVRFVCISRAEADESIRTFWLDNALTLPYSAQTSSTIYNLFATKVIPRIYISDSDGIVRHTFTERVGEEALRLDIVDVLDYKNQE